MTLLLVNIYKMWNLLGHFFPLRVADLHYFSCIVSIQVKIRSAKYGSLKPFPYTQPLAILRALPTQICSLRLLKWRQTKRN